MAAASRENDSHDHEDDEEESGASDSLLGRLFNSCSDDPKGSVHRAWGVSLLFLVLYFILSIFEMLSLHHAGASRALVMGSIWTGILHLTLAILGTFVLKRFPTSFALGFLLGILVVTANQNIILFGVFHSYQFGHSPTNHIFSSLCFTLALVMIFFTALLVHFRNELVVAPVDVKGFRGGSSSGAAAAKAPTLATDSDTEAAFGYHNNTR